MMGMVNVRPVAHFAKSVWAGSVVSFVSLGSIAAGINLLGM